MKNVAKKVIRSFRSAWRFANGKDDISVRESLGHLFLKGAGLEIGALHNPMQVSKSASVQYVDRLSNEDLLKHYPEMRSKSVVKVDIISGAEMLEGVPDQSQDFVIANHVLEHCENPILAIENMLRILKPIGRIFLSIPDMRFTFDQKRQPTPYEHLIQDYRAGAEGSRASHYAEWVRDVSGLAGEAAEVEAKKLQSSQYSIHFHAWRMIDLLQMLTALQVELAFPLEIELICRNGAENVVVLGKRS